MPSPNPNRERLICSDCSAEIFCDVNMIMVHDELWTQIIWIHPNLHEEDALCDSCMEKRLGRELTRRDWKKTKGRFAPCNIMSEEYRKKATAALAR